MFSSSPEFSDLNLASLPVLQDLLTHEDPALRADAVCALGDRIRSGEEKELSLTLRESMGKLLCDGVPLVRLEAAIALAEVQDHRATSVLVSALRHRAFRLDAIRALGKTGDANAVEPLSAFLKRWLMPWADRLQAAAALCALGNQEGQSYLKTRLGSRRPAERAAAIYFLGESKHPCALEILLELVQDREEAMRDVAVRALGILGDHRAIATLSEAREDSQQELTEDIDEALAVLRRYLP